ncbi:2-oxoacid:acceptor oxidoreductase family protein [Myxococcota bacterium]|nr:2-oxoacid:acceptor oxidoreductase family protein [Myxococcota bacterium]MBU1896951.1 2-oxoacid:acceptor oxidoreductase family protein [Myxococcota bacterium]
MKVYEKPNALYGTFERKTGPALESTHYCQGCSHGNVHKMIAEALVDFGVQDRTVFVSPVGCAVFGFYYFDTGHIQAAHGRAPAVATGIKRANPNSIVLSYQGDGDLAAIGTAETIHAANRGENITVIFINNAIYGMTGGQMAPTTLIEQHTTTTPGGRVEGIHGNPIRMCEMISTLTAPTYVERVAIGNSKHIMKARKAIRKALQIQIEGRGYSFIEILSTCPSGWKMTPPDARDWMLEHMTKVFPLGVFKDESKAREPGSWDRVIKPFEPEAVGAYLKDFVGATVADPSQSKPQEMHCKFAGFGGQGILTMGLFWAQLAMRAGSKVSWIPSYGPEMRGGTANCQVNIADERIGTPLVEEPTMLAVMNQPSLEKFEAEVVPGGVLLVDTSMVKTAPTRTDIKTVLIPASEMANQMGTSKVANVILLGALTAATDAFPFEYVIKTLPELIKKKSLVEMNIEAFTRGYQYVREQQNG